MGSSRVLNIESVPFEGCERAVSNVISRQGVFSFFLTCLSLTAFAVQGACLGLGIGIFGVQSVRCETAMGKRPCLSLCCDSRFRRVWDWKRRRCGVQYVVKRNGKGLDPSIGPFDSNRVPNRRACGPRGWGKRLREYAPKGLPPLTFVSRPAFSGPSYRKGPVIREVSSSGRERGLFSVCLDRCHSRMAVRVPSALGGWGEIVDDLPMVRPEVLQPKVSRRSVFEVRESLRGFVRPCQDSLHVGSRSRSLWSGGRGSPETCENRGCRKA